jgi:hypothetical protein
MAFAPSVAERNGGIGGGAHDITAPAPPVSQAVFSDVLRRGALSFDSAHWSASPHR